MLPALKVGTLRKPVGGGYTPTDADAIAWLAASSGSYNDTEKQALNTLFSGIKTDALWRFDRLWLYHFADNVSDSLRCFATRQNASIVNAPVFTRRQGWKGSPGYINTNWAPSNGVNYQLNNASMGCYVRQTVSTNGMSLFHVQSSAGHRAGIFRASDGNNSAFRANSNALDLFPVANLPGNNSFAMIGREASTGAVGRVNDTSFANSVASSDRPNISMFIHARNLNGTADLISDAQMSLFFAGGFFSATEWATLRNRFATFHTAIGFS